MQLKPCPFRQVDGDGNILCDKIKTGDRAVSPNVCRACPIAAIHCTHLRATLAHQSHAPVVVRYGNGKTEVWEDPVPPLAMDRAACAEKVIPIHSPRDCAGCPLRVPLTAETADGADPIRPAVLAAERRPTTDRRPNTRSLPVTDHPSPVAAAAPMAAQPAPTIDDAEKQRSTIVAQKIIKLQEWLEKQKRAPRDEGDEVQPIAMAMPRAQPAPQREEKRVGWTD